MTMKINWLGIDSILAAPLIIDLSRFMEHALREGKVGIMEHLSLLKLQLEQMSMPLISNTKRY